MEPLPEHRPQQRPGRLSGTPQTAPVPGGGGISSQAVAVGALVCVGILAAMLPESPAVQPVAAPPPVSASAAPVARPLSMPTGRRTLAAEDRDSEALRASAMMDSDYEPPRREEVPPAASASESVPAKSEAQSAARTRSMAAEDGIVEARSIRVREQAPKRVLRKAWGVAESPVPAAPAAAACQGCAQLPGVFRESSIGRTPNSWGHDPVSYAQGGGFNVRPSPSAFSGNGANGSTPNSWVRCD